MSEKLTQQSELEKLKEVFKKVDPDKQKLVEKLIHEAAFLAGQNDHLRSLITQTGMIKTHPTQPNLQKPTETGKQYLRNLQAYSVVIKTLGAVLTKNAIEEEDALDSFLDEDE